MALIMLVVISLVGVAAMRGSISSEQITKNLRSNTMAMQAAETALRYCETRALAGGAGLVINGVADQGDPVLWRTRANWNIDTITTILPADAVVNAGVAQAAPRPRCLVETYRLRRGDPDSTQRDPLQITAVGYTPDYRTESGQVVSGGEVWLQSLMRLP